MERSNWTLTPVLLALALQGELAPIIRIDSREQGRTFYVDPYKPELRKALRDVSQPAAAGDIPVWVAPFPGATPWGSAASNQPADFGVATYNSAAAADAVFGYYEARIRSTAGVTITYTNRQPGRGGAIHAEDAWRTAVVGVSPGPRGTAISVNWRPKVIRPVPLAAKAYLTAIVYDDSKGTLRLRDRATNKEYELGMATMLRYARSVALEPSARTDFPAFIAFYPGARILTAFAPPVGWLPQGPADMRSYRVEQTTTATVEQVATFYRDVMERNGLTILSETKSQGRYAFEARTADTRHVLYLDVLKQTANTKIGILDHYSWPRP
jgi:hypothetical protein